MVKNILCIDDVDSNLFILESVFAAYQTGSYDAYNVFTALSAQDGLEILQHDKIDIVLLDIMMPEVDGFAMAKIIRANRKLKNIPIIFVTAKTDDETIQKCFEMGNDYINKPFNSTELLTRVDFHLKYHDKEQLLEEQKEYAQSIVDLQDNLIAVVDGTKTVAVNKEVLTFFGVKSLEEFQKRYMNAKDVFIQQNGYFHLGAVPDGKYWVDEVIERLHNGEEVVVGMRDKNGSVRDFTVKAKKTFGNYILSLTDITAISRQKQKYEHDANHDGLTKIYNRNAFNHFVTEKLEQMKKAQEPVSIALFDIDHFKKVNDTYGHIVGDEVLKRIASIVGKNIREKDIFARWGGEEFILLFDTDKKHAVKIVENLRKLIEQEHFDVVGGITCSFGVTDLRKLDTIESVTERVDEALYEAKESGRNRVCIK